MFKSKLFAAMTLFFTILAVVSTITLARAAYAAGNDDVFMDEGDGDFGQAPVASEPASAPAAQADANIVDTPAIPPLVDDQLESTSSAPTEDPAAPAAVTPKEKKSKKKSSKKKSDKVAVVDSVPAAPAPAPVAAKGSFVTTKEACPMMRTPASTGETMLTVKASKKIWVEQAGDGWVKGWNKAGEPGYISKECVR